MLPRGFELYKAAEKGDVITVRKLILENKVPYNLRFDEYGNENSLGRDAFFIAAKKGHRKVVELLLQEGQDPNSTYLANEVSALHVAAHFGHSEIIKLLIEYHADVNQCNKKNNTPIDDADPSVVDLLWGFGRRV